jgi:hypothetical protein
VQTSLETSAPVDAPRPGIVEHSGIVDPGVTSTAPVAPQLYGRLSLKWLGVEYECCALSVSRCAR